MSDNIRYAADGSFQRGGVEAMDVEAGSEALKKKAEKKPPKSGVKSVGAPEAPKPVKPGSFSLDSLRASAAKASSTVSETKLPPQGSLSLGSMETKPIEKAEPAPVEAQELEQKQEPVAEPQQETASDSLSPQGQEEHLANEGASAQAEHESMGRSEGEAVASDAPTATTSESATAATVPEPEVKSSVEAPTKVAERAAPVPTPEPEQAAPVETPVPEVVVPSAEKKVVEFSKAEEPAPTLTPAPTQRTNLDLGSLRSQAKSTSQESTKPADTDLNMKQSEPAKVEGMSLDGGATTVSEEDKELGFTGEGFKLSTLQEFCAMSSISESEIVRWTTRCMKTIVRMSASILSWGTDAKVRFYNFMPAQSSDRANVVLGCGDYIVCVNVDFRKNVCFEANQHIAIQGKDVVDKHGFFMAIYSERLRKSITV